MAYFGGQAAEVSAVTFERRPEADADAFRCAMREFASSIALVAAGRAHKRNGCTATSLCSLSVDPPSLIVCLARTSATLATVRSEGAFGISLLATGHVDLANRFAGRSGIFGEARFEGYEWMSLATGSPLLVSSVAQIDCEVEEAIERHTHAIIVGRVLAAKAQGGRPLGYWRGRATSLP